MKQILQTEFNSQKQAILEASITIALTKPLKVLSISDGVEALLGFSQDDFISGKISLLNLIHAGDQNFAELLFSNLDSPASGSFPIRLRHANGRIRIVRLHYSTSPHESNASVILTLLLQDVRSLFLNSEEAPMTVYFKSMLDNTDDFIFFKNNNHVLVAASQTLALICPPAKHWTDLIGQTDYEIFPEEYADIYYQLEKLIYAGQIQVVNEDQEYVTKDGQKGWVNNRKYPIHNDKAELIGLFGIARDITKQKLSEQLVWHQANFDSLTELPNRTLFFNRLSKELSRARRCNLYIALLFLDLDGFKQVNDRYGHKAGDVVLKTVANRWKKCLRDMDTLARMGGDEFVVIIEGFQTSTAVICVAEKLIAALVPEVALPNNEKCQIGVSVGISISPDNATEMDSLLSAADVAMYESKARGKNTFTFSTDTPITNKGNKIWVKIDEEHLVGVKALDEQHQHLVRLVNQLNYEIVHRHDENIIHRLFDQLLNYSAFHFESELKLMKTFGYPDMEMHHQKHEALVVELQSFAQTVNQDNEILVMQTFKDRIINHILLDKPLGDFLKREAILKAE